MHITALYQWEPYEKMAGHVQQVQYTTFKIIMHMYS